MAPVADTAFDAGMMLRVSVILSPPLIVTSDVARFVEASTPSSRPPPKSSSVKNAAFRLERAEALPREPRIWHNKSLSHRIRCRKFVADGGETASAAPAGPELVAAHAVLRLERADDGVDGRPAAQF